PSPWPWRRVLASHEPIVVPVAGADLPRGAWADPPSHAVALSIALGGEGRAAVLVAGLNPFRLFDDGYRRFVELAGVQLGAGIANAEAYEQERRRAETLAELDRTKTAFFSNVSHEFRTPLTLMLEPTEDALASPERALAGEALVAVHRNELRLLKLVNTLLQFSRIEAGRARASFRRTDLAAFTSEIASGFRSAIERAGLALEVECARLSAPVYVDRDLWEHVVLNLLSNALKFTFEGGIRIVLRERGGAAELSIADTGIGIAAHHLPRVFERFHRIENVRARTHEGSGIGLALVQELVRMHGGEVSVESELDRGSTFTVAIPFGSAHLSAVTAEEPPPHDASLRAAYVAEASHWLAEPGVVPPAPGSRARILLADDNADMRDYLRRILSEHWDVTAVADGRAALDAALSGTFDLVLTDVMMPNLDGFGLLAALREDPRVRRLPTILLSARAGDEARIEGLQAGADDYLVKPFAARELIARVRTHVELNAARRRAEHAEQHLRAALSAAAIGTYSWDAAAGVVLHDEGVRRMFGFEPGEAGAGSSIGDYTARIQPDDRARWLAALEHCTREGADFDEEYRVVLPDGALHWLHDKGTMIRDAAGARAYLSGAVVDITDHKVLVERVELARQEAERANRAKDEFLAMLGHELRNPLSPIVTALTLLRHRGYAAKELDIIERQVDHVVRLVDDLLDIARITRGKVELRRQVVELEGAVAKAIEIATPLLEQRRHHLAVDVPHGLPVDADPMRLSQVVANLLTNAAKYTPKGGRIEVRATREDDRAVLAVRDNGAGIPRELLPQIFELFVQGARASDRRDGGLGLGLALVDNLVRLHGGEVSAASDGPGTGSTFVVRLPLAHPAAPAEPSAVAAPAPVPGGRRVLLVDDNVDAAELLALALRSEGHRVDIAHDGLQALALADELEPEVAVLDIGLPVMDGYELAVRLRERHARCALIALSGYGQPSDQRRSRAAGFELHLIKPVDYPALVAAISRPRGKPA
ncbi:MAG TPA: ATP-binding protein, partial [Kofleriaceae bacterium]|nr:ATP-binding protein [Kofleriaceae bacterium]